MIKRIQNHLLTHYPLLWNTRIVWALIISIITHLLFYLAGLGSVSIHTLQNHSSIFEIGGFEMNIFSVLCGICFVIVWLVFYLRNNSYKSFYIIERFHSAKEFLTIIIILFSFITFAESFNLGAVTRIRAITSKLDLIEDANVVNRSMTFIPIEKSDYFKLNNCDGSYQSYSIDDYKDTLNSDLPDTTLLRIKKALREPDAFSYFNFCNTTVNLGKYALTENISWKDANRRLMGSGNRDSIKLIIQAFDRVCEKYKIDRHIPIDKLVQLVFENPRNEVTLLMNIKSDYRAMPEGANYLPANNYLELHNLTTAIGLVDESYQYSGGREFWGILHVKLYFVISFAILLLCYRLYSRRIYLFSLIGIIVWSIIFGLLGSSMQGEGLGGLYIFLFVTFLVLSILLLRSKSGKFFSGILLNWHILMVPFIMMIILALVEDTFRHNMSPYSAYLNDSIPANDHLYYEALKKYPIGEWVTNHAELLMWLNLLIVFLYTAFFFTSISKRWHISPEE